MKQEVLLSLKLDKSVQLCSLDFVTSGIRFVIPSHLVATTKSVHGWSPHSLSRGIRSFL